jgi:hypothetical protein
VHEQQHQTALSALSNVRFGFWSVHLLSSPRIRKEPAFLSIVLKSRGIGTGFECVSAQISAAIYPQTEGRIARNTFQHAENLVLDRTGGYKMHARTALLPRICTNASLDNQVLETNQARLHTLEDRPQMQRRLTAFLGIFEWAYLACFRY